MAPCRPDPSKQAAATTGAARDVAATVDTSHFQTPAALALLTAWDRWRAARLLPARADMRLADIAALLPNVILVEVPAPDQAIIRLAGTLICAVVGQELKGTNLLDWTPPEARALRIARLQHIVRQPCAGLGLGHAQALSGLDFMMETLNLPVLPDQPGAAMQILTVVTRVPGEPRPSHVAATQIGRLPERFRFVDIGAGLPADG